MDNYRKLQPYIVISRKEQFTLGVKWLYMSFRICFETQIQVVIFWVVTPCNDVVGYQRFGGPCCLHLQNTIWTHKLCLKNQ